MKITTLGKKHLSMLLLILSLCIYLKGFTQTSLTVEDIFGSEKYDTHTLKGVQWVPNEDAFSFIDRDNDHLAIMKFDIKTQKSIVLINSKKTPELQKQYRKKRFTILNYHWSPDGRHILIPSRENLYLFNVTTKSIEQLTRDIEKERDPVFSPNAKRIAYLKNHNLYVYDIQTKTEHQITEHGTEDRLIGRFDWVYEEEFSIRTGFFWSPDSRHIAFYELEQSIEPQFPIVNHIPVHNSIDVIRYPKAGDPNAWVRIGVIPADSGAINWMNLGKEQDIYIPRIFWLPDGQGLAIHRLNRDQNRLDLLVANIASGQFSIILTEEDPNGWIDHIEDPNRWKNHSEKMWFINEGKSFLWLSEESNWSHIILYDTLGSPGRQLTQGPWDVLEILAVNEKSGLVYFIGTQKSSIQRHLFQIGLDGTGLNQLTREEGTHKIRFSKNGKYYIDQFSNITTPPRTTLHQHDGTQIAVIKPGSIEDLKDIPFPSVEFFTLETRDKLKLNAMMIKPADFSPDTVYPVLIHTYGGPGSQKVQNVWPGSTDLWHWMMTRKGYLIFKVDNRGTGFKGNDFKNLIYRNLGIGVIDQIYGAEYVKTLPYVDPDRIGIWGWSGGGYMTCMAMTKGADQFKIGVAVAPLTDPRNYDTIWMERYMDQPEDNPDGYDESNPINFIHLYKDGLFLIHGTEDDNVHLSNTLQMAYALQNARKPFHMMLYPRKLHSLQGDDTQVHLFNMITDYLLKNL